MKRIYDQATIPSSDESSSEEGTEKKKKKVKAKRPPTMSKISMVHTRMMKKRHLKDMKA
jgi:hypothetical protein